MTRLKVTPALVEAIRQLSVDHTRPMIAAKLGIYRRTVERIQVRYNIPHPGMREATILCWKDKLGSLEDRIPPWLPDELREGFLSCLRRNLGQFAATRWARKKMAAMKATV